MFCKDPSSQHRCDIVVSICTTFSYLSCDTIFFTIGGNYFGNHGNGDCRNYVIAYYFMTEVVLCK